MANQQNSYTGSQGTGTNNADFAFTFPSFTTGEVKVEVDNVVKTLTTHYTVEDYNTTSGGKVRFTTNNIPSGTTPVRIFRQTDVDTAKATFTAGSSLKAGEINDNFKQLRHALQEAIGATYDNSGNPTSRQVQRYNIEADTIDGTLIADDVINSEHYVAGSIDHEHLANDIIDGDNIQDDVINSEHYAAGSIDEEHLSNSAVTQNKLANNSVGTPELINGSVNSDKILDGTIVNADVNASAAIAGTKISPDFGSQNIVTTGTISTGSFTTSGTVDGRDIAADGTKLDTIETNAKDDQTAAEIKTLLQSNKLTASEIATGALDGRYFTETESDARYFNVSTGDTIKDGDTFPDNDTTIATTAAINDRIIDLVDDVGGFVPIANETSFPTSNPDVNDGAGTIVSVSAASTNLVPSGTTVTIANGRGSGLAVIITGVSATIPSGFGFLVETTTTDHTYAFHRLSPKATEVTTVAGISTNITDVANNETNINAVKNNETNINAVKNNETNINAVAGKATEIGRLGTVAAVADMAILGTADVVADMAILGTNDVVADLNTLGTADVVADLNTLGTADVVSDMNALATTNNITAMDTCKDNIASINNCSSNISSVNTFGDQYQVASSNPSTDGGGNALAEGDLYFNTSANELKVYNGSSWQGGVTAAGNFASTTGNTFTGDNRYNDNVKALFGTGSDLEIYHNGTHSFISDQGTGRLKLLTSFFNVQNDADNETIIQGISNGQVELYYDNSKKFETTSAGATVTGSLTVTDDITLQDDLLMGDQDTIKLGDSLDLTIQHDGTDSSIKNLSGETRIQCANIFKVTNYQNTETYIKGSLNGAVELYHDNIKKFETYSHGIRTTQNIDIQGSAYLGDNNIAYFGASQDLQIYHDGNSIIDNNTNDLIIRCDGDDVKILAQDDIVLRDNDDSTNFIHCINGGSVDLYYNGTKKFETSSAGATLTGNLAVTGTVDGVDIDALNTTVGTKFSKAGGDTITGDFTIASGTTNKNINVDVSTRVRFDDNLEATFGNDNNLKIYHTGSHSYIDQTASSGDLYIRQYGTSNSILFNGANSETFAKFTHNGSCELYHDNVNTFKTDTNGILVKGPENDYGAIFLYADEGDDDADKWAMFALASGGFKLQNYASGGWENNIIANGNGDVELYYDNSKKIETTSTGFEAYGGQFRFNGVEGGAAQLLIYADEGDDANDKWRIMANTDASFIIGTLADGSWDTCIKAVGDGQVELYHNDSKKFETNSGGVVVTDSDTTAHVNVTTSSGVAGYLYGSSNTDFGLLDGQAHWLVKGVKDGKVELRYDNSVKFETSSGGATLTGTLLPGANNTYSLGSNSATWAGIHFGDHAEAKFGNSGDYKIYFDGTVGHIKGIAGVSGINVATSNVERYQFTDGSFRPLANNTYDLGTSSLRWQNIYTNDLHLSNEGSSNEMDGTWGDWTMQEGESDLFLKNNRSGKKYKFNLTEVS